MVRVLTKAPSLAEIERRLAALRDPVIEKTLAESYSAHRKRRKRVLSPPELRRRLAKKLKGISVSELVKQDRDR
jgi:hypothetical protein